MVKIPAQLSFFRADGVTALASVDLGRILAGENYITKNGAPFRAVVKNTGDVAFTTVGVYLEQIGSYDAYLKVQMATGATAPAYPTGYVDSTTDPLALGAMAVGASVNVWVQATEPAGALPQNNKAWTFRFVVT